MQKLERQIIRNLMDFLQSGIFFFHFPPLDDFLFCRLGLMIEKDLEKSHLDLSAIKQKKASLLDWSHFASKS